MNTYRASIALLAGATLVAGSPLPLSASEVSAECRGVAAGVVAAMRAAGELEGEQMTATAVLAARRACSAALQDLGGQAGSAPASQGDDSAAAESQTTATAPQGEQDEPNIWDLLTRDRELKPGNERLRRLKTQ